jgi:hypothetical protein
MPVRVFPDAQDLGGGPALDVQISRRRFGRSSFDGVEIDDDLVLAECVPAERSSGERTS